MATSAKSRAAEIVAHDPDSDVTGTNHDTLLAPEGVELGRIGLRNKV